MGASVTPHHPQWPADFSTTSVIHFTGQPRPDFAERFFNHNAGREYAVFYQRDASVVCIDRNITRPLPKPTFTNFTYVGEAIIDYVPVYHWIYRANDGRDFFQFFDTVADRQPVRFDAEFGDRPAVQINYMEFDGGSQNPDIFSVPSEILSTCTQV